MEKDHLEILLEDMNGKLDLVLEGHQLLKRQIDGAREEAREANHRLEFKIDVVSHKVDKLDQKLDKLEQKVDRLEVKVDGVVRDLPDHRRDTEAHGTCMA